MTTRGKKKAPATTKTHDPEYRKGLAKASLSAANNGAAVISEYGKPFGDLDFHDVAEKLSEVSKEISSGNMARVEAMLIDQAHALQSMFMNFSRRALNQQYQSNLESFFKMALKAQNQCRMTLETLATIKNPPIVYAKQANVTTGPQQVNNGIATGSPNGASFPTPLCAGENGNQTNELLEVRHGERLDTGAASAASGTDKALATLEEIDRPAKP